MVVLASTTLASAQAELPGAATFVVPSPQPALHDPILGITYPLNLTDPKTIPTADHDPVYYPKAIANLTNATSEAFVQIALAEIKGIIEDNGGLSGNCSKCIAALSVGKLVAQTAPSYVYSPMNTSSCSTTIQ